MLANIPPAPGNALELGPLTINFYGIAIALGILAAATVAQRRYRRLDGDPDLASRAIIFGVVAGIIGARLGHVVTNFGRFFPDDPLGVIAFWRGGLDGLTFYSGVLFGVVTGFWVLRRGGGSLAAFADSIAPAIPIAQAIGRWGNYFNQELYGTSTDLPWALEIEQNGVIVDTVHPTFAYEMLGNLVIAAMLIRMGRRESLRQGSLLFIYMISYGVLRFLTELLRTDTEFRFLGLSRNGWGSVLVFIVGIVALWLHQRRPLLPDWSKKPETAETAEA